MPNSSCELTVLAFDFGMKRIGVAIGDTLSNSAKPLTTITAIDGIPNWDNITALIKDWDADTLIIGMPYNHDGSIQDITHSAKKFYNRIKSKYALPTHFIDERLTTKIAKIELAKLHKNNYSMDSMAATLILQSWLNEHQLGNKGV